MLWQATKTFFPLTEEAIVAWPEKMTGYPALNPLGTDLELFHFFLVRHFFKLETPGTQPFLSVEHPDKLCPPAIKHWLTKFAQSPPDLL